MFFYLWAHRERPALGSRDFFKTWAKRVWTLPALLRVALTRGRLVRGGAHIAADACIVQLNLQGRLSNLTVGSSTLIGRADIALHDKLTIGSCVCINDGVTILTASHELRDPLWRHKLGAISIGDYAWIATGATLLPGVTIGRGAVVGASAVVSRNVPDYGLAIGNPAVIRQEKRAHDLQYNPVQFLAFQDAWLGKEFRESPRE